VWRGEQSVGGKSAVQGLNVGIAVRNVVTAICWRGCARRDDMTIGGYDRCLGIAAMRGHRTTGALPVANTGVVDALFIGDFGFETGRCTALVTREFTVIPQSYKVQVHFWRSTER